MKSFFNHIFSRLRRACRRFYYDDHIFRLAKQQSRASLVTYRTFGIEFRRQDYALLLRACRASKQNVLTFLKQAALQQARLMIEIKPSGRIQ